MRGEVLKQPEELDKEGMLNDLDGFPRQVEEAIEIGKNATGVLDLSNFEKICVTGMGGSAIIGDLLEIFIEPPTFVNRSYNLPTHVTSEDLLIVVSYSGNTEETVSAMKEAFEAGMSMVSISTGGNVRSFCEENEVPFIEIPKGHQPRASLGYMLFPLLEIFQEQGLTSDFSYGDLISGLDEKSKLLGSGSSLEENPAKRLAVELYEQIPLIYGTEKNNKAVAYRWKTQFNENAKQPAFWNVFPELNHNETVGYELSGKLMDNILVLLLKNGLESERNQLRIEVMEMILEDRGVPYRLIETGEGSYVKRTMEQIYLGDYVSTYLALLNGRDPSPVKLIDKFKKEMKGRRR